MPCRDGLGFIERRRVRSDLREQDVALDQVECRRHYWASGPARRFPFVAFCVREQGPLDASVTTVTRPRDTRHWLGTCRQLSSHHENSFQDGAPAQEPHRPPSWRRDDAAGSHGSRARAALFAAESRRDAVLPPGVVARGTDSESASLLRDQRKCRRQQRGSVFTGCHLPAHAGDR